MNANTTKYFRTAGLAILTIMLIGIGSVFQNDVLRVNADMQVLLVNTVAIPFGTVFPGEILDKTYTVSLDNAAASAEYKTELNAVPGQQNLCPFLTVQSLDVGENDTLAKANLKKPSDKIDHWQVRFNVPGFKGQVSQDHSGKIIVHDGNYSCKISINQKKSEKIDLEGCDDDFWKDSKHNDQWKGYDPKTKFSSVFQNAFPGMTLGDVLKLSGNGLNGLGREAVSALLNANNPNLAYAFDKDEIIRMFDDAYSSKHYDDGSHKLGDENHKHCKFKDVSWHFPHIADSFKNFKPKLW